MRGDLRSNIGQGKGADMMGKLDTCWGDVHGAWSVMLLMVI